MSHGSFLSAFPMKQSSSLSCVIVFDEHLLWFSPRAPVRTVWRIFGLIDGVLVSSRCRKLDVRLRAHRSRVNTTPALWFMRSAHSCRRSRLGKSVNMTESCQLGADGGRDGPLSTRLGLCSLFSHFNSLQHHNAVFPCSPRPHVCLVMSQLGVNASLVMSPRAPRLTPSPPELEKAAAQLSQACGSQPADCNKASQHPDSAHTRWGKRSKRRYWQVLPWSD